MNCVLGIDSSLTSTGVVVLDERGGLLKAQAIRGEGRDVVRLWRLKEAFSWFLSAATADCAIGGHVITHAVLEGYGYSANGQRLAELGEWVGQIKLILFDYDILRLVVPPARLKKFTTGRGNAQKDEMRLAVFKRWGYEAKENDLIDAYALAQLGRAVLGWETNLTKAQREVVEAMGKGKLPQAGKGGAS